MTNRELLTNLGACNGAIEWAAKYKTPQAAWKACKRGDWMLWLCGKVAGPPDSETRRRLVLVAAECAATSLHLIAAKAIRAMREENARLTAQNAELVAALTRVWEIVTKWRRDVAHMTSAEAMREIAEAMGIRE